MANANYIRADCVSGVRTCCVAGEVSLRIALARGQIDVLYGCAPQIKF